MRVVPVVRGAFCSQVSLVVPSSRVFFHLGETDVSVFPGSSGIYSTQLGQEL